MRWFGKRNKEIDLKSLFENADWPKTYNVRIHLNDGDIIEAAGITDEAMEDLRDAITCDSGGVITTTDKTSRKVLTVPTESISYYVAEEVHTQMWTEDNL